MTRARQCHGDRSTGLPRQLYEPSPGSRVERRKCQQYPRGTQCESFPRRIDFEDWLAANSYDAVVMPTQTDVAPSDADRNPSSAEIAWRNGVWVSTGTLVFRHLGIPTVTVPMGTARDIGMPFGLTLATSAYKDAELITLASIFEALCPRRTAPPRTPEI